MRQARHRGEPVGGSRRVRVVSDRRDTAHPMDLSNVNVTVSDLQGPDGQVIPRHQFHPVSRKIYARQFVQSQLERIESTSGSRLVSRCADPIHRSGHRQAAIRCAL